MQDPLISQPLKFRREDAPPHFLRAQALPYPELKRVWARVELTPFAGSPDLEMTVLGPEQTVAASMVMVAVQHTYVSLTLHLRQVIPGQRYHLLLHLTRDGLLLDQRSVPFDLVFVEREVAEAEAEAMTWPERAVPITPLDPEDTGLPQ